MSILVGMPDEVVDCLFCGAEVTLVFSVHGGFKPILEATCLECRAYIWTEPALIGEDSVDVWGLPSVQLSPSVRLQKRKGVKVP